MFFRTRIFKRQYFVAISLFSSVELAPKARIDYRLMHGTYAVKCGREGDCAQLGWAHVSPFASATCYWNEQMREKAHKLAWWEDGILFQRWEGRLEPDFKKLDDVQLTVVYEAKTKYEREAANDAWAKLLAGYPAYIEWYDASSDRRWTKLFRPNALQQSSS
jgi:hypothetical protein